MELTEEALAKLLEEVKAGKKVSLHTAEETNEIVQKRLGKEKPKLESANSQIAQLQGQVSDLTKKMEDAARTAANEGKTEIEKLRQDMADEKKARKALLAEKKAIEEKAESMRKARLTDFRRQELGKLLLKVERFNPEALEDALDRADSVLGNVLEVAEDNGKPRSLSGKNPTTLESVDPAELVKEFVTTRPYYQIAKPSGGGADPSKAGGTPTPKDWKEGKNEGEQWATAFNQFASGPAGKPTKEGGAQT